MDIDPVIASWVLEFLLRQPLDDRALNCLLRALPLPKDNRNLQKSLLLKKLESEVSRRLVSETTLELLEQLEEIEFRRGNEAVSGTMKGAYCAVAVECTLKPLKAGDDFDIWRKLKLFEMVNKVWRGRIGRMEKVVEKGGLGSEMLSAWKDEIEAAVWDDSVCDSVLKKFEGVQADEAVMVYLREEREKIGPSFLELVAERVKNDEGLQEILGVNGMDGVAGEETPSRRDQAANGSNDCKEMHNGKIKLKFPSSAEVIKVREALEVSLMELRAVMKDPFPDALRIAEAISRERDGSQEDIACKVVPPLSSPKRINTSPLKLYEINNLKKRREGRKWSLMEADTLRAGVKKYGKGNWKVILTAYGGAFEGRTEVDLKDKWRNLMRYCKV